MPDRTCQRCEATFEVVKFSSAKWCEECKPIVQRERMRAFDAKRRPRPVHTLVCEHCNATFEHSGMGPKPKRCPTCRENWQEIYDQLHRQRPKGWGTGRARGWHLQSRFGLSEAQWDALFESQGRRCAICRTDKRSKQWNTDHDHETGEVRGILCGPCNRGLGQFRDDARVLRAAARYLESRSGGVPVVPQKPQFERTALF